LTVERAAALKLWPELRPAEENGASASDTEFSVAVSEPEPASTMVTQRRKPGQKGHQRAAVLAYLQKNNPPETVSDAAIQAALKEQGKIVSERTVGRARGRK